MLKRMLICALYIGWVTASQAQAGQADRVLQRLALHHSVIGKVTIPGTGYEVDLTTPASASRDARPSPALLQAIVSWLSASFGLPDDHGYPSVVFVPIAKIATFHYTGLLSDPPQDAPRGQREVVAAYDGVANAIYLPAGWSGTTPAELSMLVHELVHHLQRIGRIRYECTQASETLAYAAQDKWLALFGRDLATDFDIDAFTALVSTRCIY
jgi:hypothetical protein